MAKVEGQEQVFNDTVRAFLDDDLKNVFLNEALNIKRMLQERIIDEAQNEDEMFLASCVYVFLDNDGYPVVSIEPGKTPSGEDRGVVFRRMEFGYSKRGVSAIFRKLLKFLGSM